MVDSQQDEQDDLQKYLEEKAKQEQESEKEPDAYDACVLRESAKIHELVAREGKTLNSSIDE